jgi:hypothetical protein
MKRLCDVPMCRGDGIDHPLGWLCARHMVLADASRLAGEMFPAEAFSPIAKDDADDDVRAECYALWCGRMAKEAA